MKFAKLSAVLLAAFGALFWLWLAWPLAGDASPEQPPRPEVLQEQPAMPVSAEASSPATAPPTAGRSAVEPADHPGTTGTAQISAVLVDEQQQPVSAAQLWVRGYGFPALHGTSDANGSVIVELEIPAELAAFARRHDHGRLSLRCDVSHPAHANERREAQLALDGDLVLDLGRLVLTAGGTITGLVVEASGATVADAKVQVEAAAVVKRSLGGMISHGPGTTGAAATNTDRHGQFRLTGVRVGTVTVQAEVDRFTRGESGPVEVQAGQENREPVRIVLDQVPAADRLSGIVLDANGEPVPRAAIAMSYRALFSSGSSSSTAGSDGRFELKTESRGAHRVLAVDRRDAWQVAFEPALKPGKPQVLRLVRPGRMELRICDDAGRPIPQAKVWIGHANRPDHSFTGHAGLVVGGGWAEVPRPNLPFKLLVEAFGHEDTEVGPIDPATQSGDMPRVDCNLQRAPVITGTVQATGSAVAGALVGIHRRPSNATRHNGFPVWLDPRPVAIVHSDEQGRFQATMQGSFEFFVRVRAEGYAIAEAGPFPAERATQRQPFELELDAGGVIEGQLIPEPGAVAAGRIVGISRGDGNAQTQRLGQDGRYHFPRLTPGRWMLRLCDEELDPDSSSSSSNSASPYTETPSVCEVRTGQTTTYDLVLGQSSDCQLEGSLQLGQTSMAGWTLRATATGDDPAIVQASLSRAGGFALSLGQPGSYRLWFSEPGSGFRRCLEATITIEAGPNHWQLALPTGDLTVTELPPRQPLNPPTAVRWRGAKGTLFLVPVVSDSQSNCQLSDVPVGAVELVRATPSTFDEPGRWPALARAAVKPDQVTKLPLPAGR